MHCTMVTMTTLTIGLGCALAVPGLGRAARAQAPPAGPTLVVSAQAVTASGMTPGGTVVWLGMARQVVDYEAAFVRRHGIVQADALGNAPRRL